MPSFGLFVPGLVHVFQSCAYLSTALDTGVSAVANILSSESIAVHPPTLSVTN